MIYVLHHAASLALAVAGAHAMLRAAWPHRTPRLAIAIWQTLTTTAALAVIGLLVSLGLEPYERGVVPALGHLFDDLGHGVYPESLSPLHLMWLLMASVLALSVLAGLAVTASSVMARRQRLRQLVRLVTEPSDRTIDSPVHVIDHTGIVAYCIPGRRGDVIVSAGVLNALTPAELNAVLLHEQAHIRQRHDLVLFPFATLARFLPWSRLVRAANSRIELLVEMCADDYAAARSEADGLVSALTQFRTLGIQAAPRGSFAAAQDAVDERCQRLRQPRSQLTNMLALVGLVTASVLLATPISLFLLPL